MTAVLIGSVYWLFALQLDKTVASLTQLQEEHAEVTHLLIEAKVDNAERKGKQASARTAPMAVQSNLSDTLMSLRHIKESAYTSKAKT